MQHHEEADAECLHRLQAGDDTALHEIIERWKQPLANFLFRYLQEESTAIDLTQETFVRLYQNRHRFEKKSRFSTWLFSIALNLARHHCRWRNRHPTISAEEIPATNWPHQALSPAESLQQKEEQEAIHLAIQNLPDDLKSTLLLFEYENLSYQEIASISGCTAKAIETRLYRARQQLKKALQAWLS